MSREAMTREEFAHTMKVKARSFNEVHFKLWLEKPETKLIMSLIPAGENPDAMQTILRGAFNAGSEAGADFVQGEMAHMICGIVFKKDD